jgi:hypothetical protein
MQLLKRILPILMLCFCACKKDMTSLNVNTKAASQVPSFTLFSDAQKNLTDVISTPDQLINVFELLSQYYTETTYTNEANYYIDAVNLPKVWWGVLYRDVLNNLAEAKRLVPADVTDAAVARNEADVIDVMQIYTWSLLVNTFGNVPYTQALDPVKYPFPVYDDAKTIYYDLLARLDSSIAGMNTSSASFGNADLIFQGDMTKWLVFANSLKLKMGMLIADSDPVLSAQKVTEAVGAGVMQSNGDNATFNYLSTPPNTNPKWTYFVQAGRIDMIIAESFADTLNNLSDPRRPQYFTTDLSGTNYSGGVAGKSNPFANFSKPSDKATAASFPVLYMDYSEVEFLLAEAVARGMQVAGTSESHYNKAITASIEYWGGTPSEISDYLNNPKVKYTTAAGSGFKEKIGLQKWIALYDRGFDGWTEIRRLGYPLLPAPIAATSDFPVRYRYPSNETTSNGTNYAAAATAIGGDEVTTKLFWMK